MEARHYPNLGFSFLGHYARQMSKSKFTKADALFRKVLRLERTSKGLTQAALAARLDQPQSYVSKYETGERRLDFVETLLVCDALEIDIGHLAATLSAEVRKVRGRKAD
jgi:transcriptional regulator with XRE-family HTH domain